jgi:hypothetical protein
MTIPHRPERSDKSTIPTYLTCNHKQAEDEAIVIFIFALAHTLTTATATKRMEYEDNRSGFPGGLARHGIDAKYRRAVLFDVFKR